MGKQSWMTGDCKACCYPVVVTQGQTEDADYCWYCSNPKCEHHSEKENLVDQDEPDWVFL